MSMQQQSSTSFDATDVAYCGKEPSIISDGERLGYDVVQSDEDYEDLTSAVASLPIVDETSLKQNETQSGPTKPKSMKRVEAKKKSGLNPRMISMIKKIQEEKSRREKEFEEEQRAEQMRIRRLDEERVAIERERLAREQASKQQEKRSTAKKPIKSGAQTIANAPTQIVKKRTLYPDRVKVVVHSEASSAPCATTNESPKEETTTWTNIDAEWDANPTVEWESAFDGISEREYKQMTSPEIEVISEVVDECPQDCRATAVRRRLRAPIFCVLGHVDVGKTTLLDHLRQTHVQKNEAGGITQQIGATYLPLEVIHQRTRMCGDVGDEIPGLLMIDTPGHETFRHLRSRGTSLCDLVILVVNIMHGLEPKTLESIELLMEGKIPFVVALNKIDQVYGWNSNSGKDIRTVMEEQKPSTKNHLEKLINTVIVQFAEKGLNVGLFDEERDWNDYHPMVPISASTGDGIGSLIAHVIEQSKTTLAKALVYSDEMQATVMEVKSTEGLGITIDVLLRNGRLSTGDRILIGTIQGPVTTQIRSIWVPRSSEELRVTNHFEQHDVVMGTRSLRIVANDLEQALAGLPLFLVRNKEDEEHYKKELDMARMDMLTSMKVSKRGIHIQASTLGSLEALIELLTSNNIPFAGVSLGPVHRKDVLRASAKIDKDEKYAVILAFDVPIDRTAQEYAASKNIKIIQDDEIYRLVNRFKQYENDLFIQNKERNRDLAVFPCQLRILAHCIFARRDPIICGVRVEEGVVRVGTPICVPSKEFIELGRITSIQMNHKQLDIARTGDTVCIRIEPVPGQIPKMYGRHFDEHDLLTSKISRLSIDTLKTYFRDEMAQQDWILMIKMKKIFQIV